MDFLKILKSFEEFVYEALTWLVLLPRTLVRIVLTPDRMTRYAAHQLASDSETRFSAAISPPLLLILCVLLAHGIDLGIRHPALVEDDSLAGLVLASEENLLLYRTIAFGIWALAGAVYLLARTRRTIDRESLRAPFYEQCYLVSPFALVVSVALTFIAMDDRRLMAVAVVLVLASGAWFWCVQAVWLRRRAGLALWRSAVAATVVLAFGSTVNAGVGHLLSGAKSVTVATPASARPCEGTCPTSPAPAVESTS